MIGNAAVRQHDKGHEHAPIRKKTPARSSNANCPPQTASMHRNRARPLPSFSAVGVPPGGRSICQQQRQEEREHGNRR
jgi:hypothetical protein